jgi:hypothetical protein
MDAHARNAEHGGRTLQVLPDVGLAVTRRYRKAQARVGALRNPAPTREEGVPKTGIAQERTFQELGVVGHGWSFMRPAGPVKQVSIVESERTALPRHRRERWIGDLCQSNPDVEARRRSPHS